MGFAQPLYLAPLRRIRKRYGVLRDAHLEQRQVIWSSCVCMYNTSSLTVSTIPTFPSSSAISSIHHEYHSEAEALKADM